MISAYYSQTNKIMKQKYKSIINILLKIIREDSKKD